MLDELDDTIMNTMGRGPEVYAAVNTKAAAYVEASHAAPPEPPSLHGVASYLEW